MKETLFVCMVLFGLIVTAPFSYSADTIKVGIVDTYGGPPTIFTYNMRDDFAMAVNKINAKGGALGKKIEFTTRDEKFKPDIALAMARELVWREKVDILVGTISSGTALTVSAFAKCP